MSRKERQTLIVKKKEKRRLIEEHVKRRWSKEDSKAMNNLLDEAKEILNLK